MIAPDLHICDKSHLIYKDNRFWCVAEEPVMCPYAFHLDFIAYECIHPEHLNFFKSKPSTKH